jgi:hypothetical protein
MEGIQASRGWLRAASLTLLHHLCHCNHQGDQIHQQATHDHIFRGGADPVPLQDRRRRRREASDDMSSRDMPPPDFILNSPQVSPIAGSSMGHHYSQYVPSRPPSPTASISSTSSHRPNLSQYVDPLVVSHSDSGSSSHSITQTFSRPQPHHGRERPLSRQWSMVETFGPWSAEKQARFERRIVRLTAAAGFPLSWVDNIEWIDFVEEFLPAAKSPSRKTLTRRLLPSAIKDLRAEVIAAVKGHEATIQADGWTGVNTHHLIAFMITANGQVGSLV